MKYLLTNWKTSLAGAGILLTTVLTTILPVLSPEYAVIATGVIAALGLFAAKDKNVTGGDTKQ